MLTIQVLWLGQPDCFATWEPAVSLPQSLVQQFEGGIVPEARVETIQLYGHMSSTLTVSQQGSLTLEAKRMRLERPYHEDLEGYARTTVNVQCVYIRLLSRPTNHDEKVTIAYYYTTQTFASLK